MLKSLALICLSMISLSSIAQESELRIATFNVSMDASNYISRGEAPTGNELFERLASGEHAQVKNIARILQIVRPDIVLLNEFDYTSDPAKGALAFMKNYLLVSQQGEAPINYPYFYTNTVNTGVPSGHDLDRDGTVSVNGNDALGFGMYPGQYGMLVLSRYPLDSERVRTFQHFLWKDMPNNLLDTIQTENGTPWFSSEAKAILRLSSKSHWDLPVEVNGETIHLLVSHPTPPVFDGPEDRNGKRNHDEVRFWVDYISGGNQANYIYDDQGQSGGFEGKRFVVLGDLNSALPEGASLKGAIGGLLTHEKVQGDIIPISEGGRLHSPDNPLGKTHTAYWRMRADYVLPSKLGFKAIDSGIFWPAKTDPLFSLIEKRESSSDHRLVWVDMQLN